MAKPSKQRPYALQMYALGKWYTVDAFSDREIAEAHAKLANRRETETKWQIIDTQRSKSDVANLHVGPHAGRDRNS